MPPCLLRMPKRWHRVPIAAHRAAPACPALPQCRFQRVWRLSPSAASVLDPFPVRNGCKRRVSGRPPPPRPEGPAPPLLRRLPPAAPASPPACAGIPPPRRPFSPDSVSAAVPKQPSNALCEADGPLAAGSVRGVRHHRLQGAEGLFNVFCFQKQGIYILRP